MSPHSTEDSFANVNFSAPNGQESTPRASHDPLEAIAVVGFALGFPQEATTSDALWELMCQKRSTVSDIPKSRMNIDAMYHPDVNRRGQVPVRRAHFLSQDLAEFDASFFATSTTDAAVMDPQQRLLLEYTYQALENAGLPMEKVSGTRTSVYSGSFSTDWQHLQYKDGEVCTTTAALGTQPCFNANRVSWFFNLKGNSANVDTACSSSLVGLHLGCQGLRLGDEDMSIVMGSNISLSPDNVHTLTNLNMLSPDGECFSFDSRGNGYSRGEGVGVLVLKRVSDAIRDNDTIRGIIRSTGCNQDGHTPSITLPSSEMQAKLIRDTYQKAGLSMEPVRFFEAHGTGTSVGDPGESRAIGSAFRHVRTTDDPLWVGSIKSNIGHLEGASGVAGVIKAMLILEKGIIVPNANFKTINPKIDAEYLRIQFPCDTMPWPKKGLRRASVNSFGNAGANAHTVLDDVYHYLQERGLSARHITVQDPPTQATVKLGSVNGPLSNPRPASTGSIGKAVHPKLLIFSANDQQGVQRQAKAYADRFSKYTQGLDPQYLEHLAYTLSFRRTALPWTSFAVASSIDDLQRLDQLISPAIKSLSSPSLGFVFAGQGAQWAGMGRELATFPPYKQSLQRSEEVLLALGSSWALQDEIWKTVESRIDTPELAQPCCTALQIALVDLLRSLGVYPAVVIGHSSGEIAAAYCKGALSFESALKVAYYRGALCGKLATDCSAPRGTMMSVGLSREDIISYLEQVTSLFNVPALTIACINSPRNVTISGDVDQIDILKAAMDAKGIFARKLAVNVAYHSPQMLRIADSYREAARTLKPGTHPPKPVAMFSSVTGTRVSANDLVDPWYWMQNMVSPVRFVDAMNALVSTAGQRIRRKLDLSHRKYFSLDMLVEISPHSALQRPVNDILLASRGANIRYTALLINGSDALSSTLHAFGSLKSLGVPVRLELANGLDADLNGSYMALPDLPSYVFDHSQKYWEESRLCSSYRLNGQGKLDLLGKPVADWNPHEARWRQFLRASEIPWIEDHGVNGLLIYPGAGMLVMAIEAANQLTKASDAVLGFELQNVCFSKPVTISRDAKGVELQLVVHLARDSPQTLSQHSEFRLFSYENGEWQECCYGFVRAKYEATQNEVDGGRAELAEVKHWQDIAFSMDETCQIQIEPKLFYSTLTESGVELGPTFQRVTEGFYDNQQRVRGKIETFRWPENEFPQPHLVHPTTLDSVLHLGFAAFSSKGKLASRTRIPTFLRRLSIHRAGLSYPDTSEVDEYVWRAVEDRRCAEYSAFIMDSTREMLLLEFDDLTLTTVAAHDERAGRDVPEASQLAYIVEYQPEPDLLSSDEIVSYCQSGSSDGKTPFQQYLSLLAHKNGGLRILEVDAGDKSLTTMVLQALSAYDHAGEVIYPRYSSFTFAQINGVPEDRKKDLESWPQTRLVNLDILKTPQDQEFEKGPYDIILAPQSAITSAIIMQRLSSLLRSGGKLILSKPCGPATNGLPSNALVDIDGSLFSKNGLAYPGFRLNTLNIVDPDPPGVQVHEYSSYSSRSLPIQPIFLVLDTASAAQTRVCDALTNHWRAEGFSSISSGSLGEAAGIASADNVIFVILMEVDQPFLYSINEQDFGSLKTLFQTASHVIWPTFSGGSEAGKPEYYLIHGLARALRSEYANLNVTIVSFEARDHVSQAQMIKLTQLLFSRHIDPSQQILDVEYLEQGQALHIPRVFPTAHITHEISKRSSTQARRLNLAQECPPLELSIGSIGMLDSLGFVEDKSADSPLAPDEVEIQTQAIGMNLRDCLVALGQIPDNPMGHECAGVVVRAGCESPFREGDRVVLAASDTFRTFARGRLALKIPDDMPFTTAAAIPAQFCTAWAAIHRIARLEPGENILVHAAAGGAGQAAIQLAQLVGATVFATVGSAEKKKLLVDQYKLPENHIFYSRDTSFVHGIKQETAGRGVDVILNSLTGNGLLASWECIAPYGRFIELAKKNILAEAPVPTYAFRKNVSYATLDGWAWIDERPVQARSDLGDVMDLFIQGRLHPAWPLQIHDIGEVEKVFRTVQTGNSMGKFVFEVTPASQVRATLDPRPSFQMDPNATFVIAGGLGGIGRATARWMADRGAKNLILLSRFGPRTDAGRSLVQELQDKGVRVETPPCDVTDLAKMQTVFDKLSSQMPPIKGVLQMSIIAKDCLFKDLEYDDWKVPVGCKTVGTWNLHTVLPSGMDFFILLSSASGLAGIKGQANYDAGNTYEDAFARYRVSQGEKTTALDLGAMVDDGILNEDPELLNRVLAYGTLEPITRQRFYAILDHYCNPALPTLSPQESQIALGLGMSGGGGLESYDYSRQPMLQPLMLAGERHAATAGTGGAGAANAGNSRVKNRERLAASTSLEEAADVIVQATILKLAKSLVAMQDTASVDCDKPLQIYGVDSLLAIELRNWIVKEFDADIAVFETQGASTLNTLSMLVAGRSTIKHQYW